MESEFSPQCLQVMELLEIPRRQAEETVADGECRLVTAGGSRFAAAKWLGEDSLVFVEGVVLKRRGALGTAGEPVRVLGQLALSLRAALPGGVLHRGMKVGEMLPLVAESFGIPVLCHPGHPPRRFYEGPWDGKTFRLAGPHRGQGVCVMGSFDKGRGRALGVWAFDFGLYRDWFFSG